MLINSSRSSGKNFIMVVNTRLFVTTLVSSLLILNLSTLTASQDFEDLNSRNQQQLPEVNSTPNHHKQSHHLQQTFQPLNRQQQQPQQPQSSQSQPQQQFSQPIQTTASTSRHSQRPMLSNRFSPQAASHTSGGSAITSQASTSTSVFAAPPTGNSSPAHSSSGANSVELLMKNALARTVKQAESRLDTSSSVEAQSESASLNSAPAVGTGRSSSSSSSVSVAQSPAGQQVSESNSSPAAAPAQASSPAVDSSMSAEESTSEKPGAHETVYSDQRFANLFARRNNAKKQRLQPTEQVKAKPTLPSFIKSLPDPKQFTAAQLAPQQDRVAASSGTTNTFASQQRIQQANQLNRVNLANQQLKKSALTSNSANIANSKRVSAINGKAGPGNGVSSLANGSASSGKLASQKIASSNSLSSTAKPQLANNPFNRAQASNSDPANVIAMARKRLLANNALESAKLKQQQTKPPTQTS